MSSPAAAGDVLPALLRIKTREAAAEPARAPSSSASTSTSPGEKKPLPEVVESDAEPRTPTSEESKLWPVTECPPAPRKPACTMPAKRKSSTSSSHSPLPSSVRRRLFFDAVRDLSAVFPSLPPKKRVHGG